MSGPIRIAMWSGPRNISTAMMRSFENRPDTSVTDEPFYAFSLLETGIDHPGREEVIQSMETDWQRIVAIITGPPPQEEEIWYQKHMAHHIHDQVELDWIRSMKNCFLIRDPREVILSYSKKYEITDPKMLGNHKQVELFNLVHENTGEIPPVIDARDVLENPREILSQLCKRMEIPFFDEMLYWPAGPRESDGIWAKHWYRAVEASTGFEPYRPREGKLTESQMRVYEEVFPLYEEIHPHRITGVKDHVPG